ncbi:MAG: ankyrin repeat domain-containing protein [Deltaproteobacteria bacterium]|nr:ankyrin repeat domain-containing protein [Deltaproteobacteria bacterium]
MRVLWTMLSLLFGSSLALGADGNPQGDLSKNPKTDPASLPATALIVSEAEAAGAAVPSLKAIIEAGSTKREDKEQGTRFQPGTPEAPEKRKEDQQKLIEEAITILGGCDKKSPKIKALLDAYEASKGQPVDVNLADSKGRLVLVEAVRWFSAESIKLLIDRGAKVNLPDNQGTLPLVLAAGESKRVVKLLIDHGANVHLADGEGRTPLFPALEWGQAEIIELLIEAGADVNQVVSGGVSPLALAIAEKKKRITELLIDRGANVNQADKDGVPLLSQAVRDNDTELVELLIEAGADVNQINEENGQSPLHCAAFLRFKGAEGIVKRLIDRGANVNRADKAGRTPLHISLTSGGYFDECASVGVVKALLDAGAEVNRPDKEDRTPVSMLTSSVPDDIQALFQKPDAETISLANTDIVDEDLLENGSQPGSGFAQSQPQTPVLSAASAASPPPFGDSAPVSPVSSPASSPRVMPSPASFASLQTAFGPDDEGSQSGFERVDSSVSLKTALWPDDEGSEFGSDSSVPEEAQQPAPVGTGNGDSVPGDQRPEVPAQAAEGTGAASVPHEGPVSQQNSIVSDTGPSGPSDAPLPAEESSNDVEQPLLGLPPVDPLAELRQAVEAQDVDCVRQHLVAVSSEQVNAYDEGGETLLFKAVILENEEIIKLLVEKGADVNKKNLPSSSFAEKSPLEWAQDLGNEGIWRLLQPQSMPAADTVEPQPQPQSRNISRYAIGGATTVAIVAAAAYAIDKFVLHPANGADPAEAEEVIGNHDDPVEDLLIPDAGIVPEELQPSMALGL